MDHLLIFYALLLIIAFLYASVGHGGASGYLALMAIFSFTPAVMKPTALMLNLFVSAIAFYQFYRGKHFLWKLFLPLAIASIPLAYIGGTIHIDAGLYKKILGLLLLIPIIRFIFFPNIAVTELRPANPYLSLLIGAVIGFLSGLIGIGGGIILSPVLLLLKWTDQKQTAAISALFIFVNSLSGLAGQFTKGIEFTGDMWFYVIIAVIGGCGGAWFGSLKFNQTILKRILAAVLLMASVKLFLT
ncbi:MAG: sulfite exporter TauE/SafE family protein [Ferruginibacter sp.]|nr:sulfite exporter TauE/SafE family protein [Ferruginibacter sp.]